MFASDLDPNVRGLLRSLSRPTAEIVARHLVMAERLIADSPSEALAHAKAARARAARVGVVREAVGIAAYEAGEFGEALTELRAARRITGTPDYLPMIADCERALGRPERAIDLLSSPEAAQLEVAERLELLIVAAGARRDLGEDQAAAAMLHVPELDSAQAGIEIARLRYAYADALAAIGRAEDARQWFAAAAAADADNVTGAQDRLLELDGVVISDSSEADDGEADDGEADDGEAEDSE